MKTIILGATGSIGLQALEIIDTKNIGGIVFNKNLKLAKQLIAKYHIKNYYSPYYLDFSTHKSYHDLLVAINPELVLNAVVGFDGLDYTIQTINKKCDLALANKESIVIAGKYVTELALENGVNIYPVDSEHSSLYDLIYNTQKPIKKLYITCSGGSVYHLDNKQLENVSLDQVLKHPNWSMGSKITIDSATLINKCFEIVEAYWLFNIKDIEALYHPQSIVHALIEHEDNSVNAHLAVTDMKLYINWALHKYQNTKPVVKQFNFCNQNLYFDQIDLNKHKPIKWAYDIINDKNNCLGTIINVSNEIAIKKYLKSEISFCQIIDFIEKNINQFKKTKITKISDIFTLKKLIINSNENK